MNVLQRWGQIGNRSKSIVCMSLFKTQLQASIARFYIAAAITLDGKKSIMRPLSRICNFSLVGLTQLNQFRLTQKYQADFTREHHRLCHRGLLPLSACDGHYKQENLFLWASKLLMLKNGG